MRYDEAKRIGEWTRSLALPSGAICLNIGSSTEDFRTRRQPHIDEFIFAPLRNSGVRVLHCDLKPEDGVDLVGDVLDPAFQKQLRALGAQLLICSNLLEHLEDPQAFASACAKLVAPGGHAIVTVPSSYPYHPDPIDTLFRPTPEQLADMFPGWQVVKKQQLACGNARADILGSRRGPSRLAHYLIRLATPFYRPRLWLAYAHRALWFFRDYQISMLLVRKVASP